MAFVHSKLSEFFITDVGGTERDITAFVTEVQGLPGGRLLADVTTLSDSGSQWLPLFNVTDITVIGLFDDQDPTGPDKIFGDLRTHTAETDFRFRTERLSLLNRTTVEYSGKVWLTTFEESSRIGNLVIWRVAMRVQNAGAIVRLFVDESLLVATIVSSLGESPDIGPFVQPVVPSPTVTLGESPDVGPFVAPVVSSPTVSIGDSPDAGPEVPNTITIATTVTDV